jgi:hypothetical protein
VASWHQTETFSNAVIFATVFGATGFTNFTVSGDAVLTGGAWQHVPNPVGAAEVNRLRVTVNGDLSITNASISADQCGHTRGYGPGRLYLNYGGAHGGKARNHEFDLNANNQTFTSLPAFAASTENTAMSRWAARNHARVGLATNAAVWSLELTSNGSLNLYGHTLLTRALTINDIRWPVGTYSAEELGASVLDVSSDGQVVVTGLKQGTIILVR